jgi:DUF4097 and DUF4098 domain-containing protein YvlB
VLALPEDACFRIDARTSSGKITSAFPVQKVGKSGKRRLQGTVGESPGVAIKAETSNGNIEIIRQDP